MQHNINIEDTLTSEHVQGILFKLIIKILLLTTKMAEKKLTMALNVLIIAAAEQKTVHRICRDREVPRTGVTIRNTLKLMFDNDVELLEKILNAMLRATLHKKIRRTSPIVSTDVILVGYYGDEETDPKEIRKGQKRNGTNSFHGYATVYANLEGERYTLAITYVWADDTMLDVIRRLNRLLKKACVSPSLWLLDKGYYSVKVIRWFKQYRKPFLMPAIWNGRKPDHRLGASGTNIYKAWTKSGWDIYRINERRGRTFVDVDMAVVVTYPDGPGRWQNAKVKIYVSYGLRHKKARDLRDLYKKRFAIETTYRQMNQARFRTASKSPVLRYLAVGLSFVMRNVWVSLHFEVLFETRRGPGGRKFPLDKLPFITMVSWIRENIASLYPLIKGIHIDTGAPVLCRDT